VKYVLDANIVARLFDGMRACWPPASDG
jgi:hypothetical protein